LHLHTPYILYSAGGMVKKRRLQVAPQIKEHSFLFELEIE